MQLAVNISLKFLTGTKKNAIANLHTEYCRVVNLYLTRLPKGRCAFDSDTQKLVSPGETRLSANLRGSAFKKALSIHNAPKKLNKTTKTHKIPTYSGAVDLTQRTCTILQNSSLKEFDLLIRVSSLKKGKTLVLTCKKHAHLNKLLSEAGAALSSSASLYPDRITIFVDAVDKELKSTGKILGVDLGKNKLISLSSGTFLGTDTSKVCDAVKTAKQKSKQKLHARRHRDQYIREAVNQLPWDFLQTLVLEDLKGIKQGKQKNRGKVFRKAMAPWAVRQAINWIEYKAQRNGVRVVFVDPANTSRCCPRCGTVSEDNRQGEKFACISCGHVADADYVGACNILAKHLGTFGQAMVAQAQK